jgi:hypothetical protein
MLEPSRSWLPGLHAWLSPAEPARPSDLIFVLAGRMSSKRYALQLFREGLSPRLLLSVGRFEIRRFSKLDLPVPLNLLELAQAAPPPERHYFVLFQGKETHVEHIPPRRFGTLTEMAALARWLDKNPEVQSLTLISNEAHLRRIGMCCRSLFPRGVKVGLVAVPHSFAESVGQKPSAFRSTRSDLLELLKVLAYRILIGN